MNIDDAVMARLKAPFGCEFIEPSATSRDGRWRIHDANDDAIASVSGREEGYARLIVEALNRHPRFHSRGETAAPDVNYVPATDAEHDAFEALPYELRIVELFRRIRIAACGPTVSMESRLREFDAIMCRLATARARITELEAVLKANK